MIDNNDSPYISRATLRAALQQRDAAESIADFNDRLPDFMREIGASLDAMKAMPTPSFLFYCIMLSHAHLTEQIALLRADLFSLRQKDPTP